MSGCQESLNCPLMPGFWHLLFGGAGKSAVRAGYGIYYDHYGEGIVHSFDQYGSFGLSESITNPTNVLTPDTSPRFTGINNLPQITGVPASNISYPTLAPNDPLWTGFQIAHGLDDHMKTPYSHVANLSVQRELPIGFTVEIAYIGRFGRDQLQQIDLAQPLNLVDVKSGQNYFGAATRLLMHLPRVAGVRIGQRRVIQRRVGVWTHAGVTVPLCIGWFLTWRQIRTACRSLPPARSIICMDCRASPRKNDVCILA
jgi:hypothetical protein